MAEALPGTWLAEVRDSLWNHEPYYPHLDEGRRMVLDGEWSDAHGALMRHLTEELAVLVGLPSGMRGDVDTSGALERLETSVLCAVQSLRTAEPGLPWEFRIDQCRYRLFVAGSAEDSSASMAEEMRDIEQMDPEVFAGCLLRRIARWDSASRPREQG